MGPCTVVREGTEPRRGEPKCRVARPRVAGRRREHAPREERHVRGEGGPEERRVLGVRLLEMVEIEPRGELRLERLEASARMPAVRPPWGRRRARRHAVARQRVQGGVANMVRLVRVGLGATARFRTRARVR